MCGCESVSWKLFESGITADSAPVSLSIGKTILCLVVGVVSERKNHSLILTCFHATLQLTLCNDSRYFTRILDLEPKENKVGKCPKNSAMLFVMRTMMQCWL